MYKPTSRIGKVFDVIQRPLYTVGGLVEYGLGRSPYRDWWKAGWAGLSGKRRTEFMELTGRPWVGLGLDILLDPLTYLPFGATTKIIKGTKIPMLIGKGAAVAGRKFPALARVGKAARMVGIRAFGDPAFPAKVAAGIDDAIRGAKALGVSDDLIKSVQNYGYADDIVKGLNEASKISLKKIDDISRWADEFFELPHQVNALRAERVEIFRKSIERFAKLQKVKPVQSAALLEAVELGLPIPVERGGKMIWGFNKSFVKNLKKAGLTSDDLRSVIDKIPPSLIDDPRSVKSFESIMGIVDTRELAKQVSGWDIPRYTALIEKTMIKLDPELAPLYKQALYVNTVMARKAVERGVLTEGIVQNFYKTFGINYLRHENVAQKLDRLQRYTARWRKTLEDGMEASLINFRNNLPKGLPYKVIDTKVAGFRKFAEYVLAGKLDEIYAGGEKVTELLDTVKNLIPEGAAGLPAKKMLVSLKNSVGDVKRMRGLLGTIREINEFAGKPIYETNLAKLIYIQETKLKTAFFYQDFLERLLKDSHGTIKTFNKGDEIPKGFKRLKDAIFGEFIVHNDIAHILERTFRISTGRSESLHKFLAAFDKGTGIWKYWTLIPFGKFHFRNLFSEILLSNIAGMRPTDPAYAMAAKLWYEARVLRKPAAMKEYYELLRKGVIGTGFFRAEAAIGVGLRKTRLIERIPVVGKIPGAGLRGMERLGEFAEDVPRIAMFKWAERTGKFKKFGFRNPVQMVRKFHPYYGKMTSFESGVMRRIFPFYSWSRFNLPLHVEMFIQNPKHYAQIERIRRAITMARGAQLPQEDDPKWIREGYAVGWSKKPGKRTYFLLKNWLPHADMSDILSFQGWKELFVRLFHPLKVLPETAWGYDTFRKRKIPAYPGEKKEMMGLRLPARPLHLLQPIRLIQDTNRAIWWGKSHSFLNLAAYTILGRMYEVDVKETRRYLSWEYKNTLRELKRGINRAKDHRDYGTQKKLQKEYDKLSRALKRL